MNTASIQSELLYFHDDGHIPNSIFPVLIYRNAFQLRGDKGAEWLELHFAMNDWSNSWRSGIFTYHHYHSTSHEVLGVYSGSTALQLGGENGTKLQVSSGDIIIIPAGVGHRNMDGENDVQVVGAYDRGRDYDILKGGADDHPLSIENIRNVPFPASDPLLGFGKGLCMTWKA
ncbi:MAG: cupin protein [Flavipsychrobacter sp.]|nr:cupin protein [Flavipsychrobacter sp.]